jgi:hypothetical protein
MFPNNIDFRYRVLPQTSGDCLDEARLEIFLMSFGDHREVLLEREDFIVRILMSTGNLKDALAALGNLWTASKTLAEVTT